MRYIVFYFWCLLLAGCGQSTSNPTNQYGLYSVPAEVEEYVQDFKDEAQERDITLYQKYLVVKFVDAIPGGDNLIGLCTYNIGGTPEVLRFSQ